MVSELIHEIIPVGLLQCNCSILGDSSTREAIVVDPGDDVEAILAILRKHQLKVRAILSTHTHIDHVGGLAALHHATGAPVLIHEKDLELYRHLEMQAQWIGMPTPERTRIQDFVKEGDSVRWGNFAARVLHTPGHTPGSISLVIDSASKVDAGETTPHADDAARGHSNVSAQPRTHGSACLLSGDTLFKGSIGRTDLWGGSYPQIISSINEKLIVLPEELVVYPGHGETTTIGEERESNPFLR